MPPADRVPPSPKRILAVKIADIGDLILTTPALRALRTRYPNAHIALLTTPHAAPILTGTGLVDEVIVFRLGTFERARDLIRPAALRVLLATGWGLRRMRFDTQITFHQLSTRGGAIKQALIALAVGARRRIGLDNGRGWFFNDKVPDRGFGVRHQAQYWGELAARLGAMPDNAPPITPQTPEDLIWAQEHLPPGPRYAALHPGSGGLNAARRWSPQGFAAVAEDVWKRLRLRIVIVGGADDGANALTALLNQSMPGQFVDLAGQTTLGQLRAVLAQCVLFVGADSGVMHLAASVPDLPLLALFGPTNHAAWGPWTGDPASTPANTPPRVRLLRSGALCSPCGYTHHAVGLRSGCVAQTCMKAISPGDVLAAIHAPPPDRPVSRRREAPALRVLGVPLDAVTYDALLNRLESWIAAPDGAMPHMICTANPELVMIAQRDSLFFDILNRADLVTADGIGLLWAARRLGHPLPERVTGSDGLPIIAARAARKGWRVFLQGAGPGVAEKAADALIAAHPGLQVAGTYGGTPCAEEEDDLVNRVNAAGADILFLAYGSPGQEKWIARNLPRLRVKVVIGVGGAFDFAAGVTQRAPRWMRQAGIEWLHRLIRQPWRWRRMLRLPRFVMAVLRRGQHPPFAFRGEAET